MLAPSENSFISSTKYHDVLWWLWCAVIVKTVVTVMWWCAWWLWRDTCAATCSVMCSDREDCDDVMMWLMTLMWCVCCDVLWCDWTTGMCHCRQAFLVIARHRIISALQCFINISDLELLALRCTNYTSEFAISSTVPTSFSLNYVL